MTPRRLKLISDPRCGLVEAGVTVLVGTDASNPGTLHGASVHDELASLVAAGMSPIQALRAATALPAERFHLEDRGVIAVGKRADLLLVEGDPTRDVTATRSVVGVWKAGHRFDHGGYLDGVQSRRKQGAAAKRGVEAGAVESVPRPPEDH